MKRRRRGRGEMKRLVATAEAGLADEEVGWGEVCRRSCRAAVMMMFCNCGTVK